MKGEGTQRPKEPSTAPKTLQQACFTQAVFQGSLPRTPAQGGPEAGSTTSTQTIQSTEATLWASLREACRKGGGHTAFNWGNFRCIVTPAPGPPLSQVLTELGRAPGLQILRGCGLWKEARSAAQQAKSRQGPSSVWAGPGHPCQYH